MSKTRDALKHPVYMPRIYGRGTRGRPLPDPWHALDTERNTQPGHPLGEYVCGYYTTLGYDAPFSSLDDLPAGVFWAWNVSYDAEGLVRNLGMDEGWAMREDSSPFTLNGAKCVYFKNKRFEYNKDGKRRILLEASSFFNRISLKEAAKTLCVCKCEPCIRHKEDAQLYPHCGIDEATCPMKDPVDASKMSLRRYRADAKYREEVNIYCAKDARLALRLMNYLRSGFTALGVEIGGTPGATARRFLSDIPHYPKVVWTTHRQFLESYCGGRFEVWKRGVMHDARGYDLVSAYPWAMSKCPMLSQAATSKFTRRVSDAALFGAYDVSLKMDEYLGVMPTWKGSTRIYSNRESSGWVTKPEIDWMQARGIDYKVHRGVEIFDESALEHGWRDIILPLFDKKEKHKKEPLGLGAKVGVNSMYGITIQLNPKGGRWVPIEEAVNPVDFAGLLALEKGPKAFEAGQFYAPCYASTLTSMVRVRILDAAIECGWNNAVASHTDSLLMIGKGRLKEGRGLGDWKLEKTADELIILKSGQYALDDNVKGRGFSKRRLNPEDLSEVPKRQKLDLYAPTHNRRGRISISTADSWGEVSLIEDKVVANNFAWEIKRKWQKDFSVRMIAKREWIDSEALGGLNGA